jgi:hypothetical protein
MRALLIGDTPSKHNICPTIAFHGTKSWRVLQTWLVELGIAKPMLANSTDIDIDAKLEYAEVGRLPIIVLGRAAEKRIKALGVCCYYALPHPSGLNRKLNNKQWLADELGRCGAWLEYQKTRF